MEREEQAFAKARAAKEKVATVVAQYIVSKVTPAVTNLAALLGNPDAKHVASFVLQAGQNHNVNLNNLLKQAQRALQDPRHEVSVSSVKEVNKMLSDCKKSEAILSQTIASIQKLL